MGARFIEGIGHQDIPWIMQLALAARRVGFVRDPLYGYLMNPVSVMNDPSKAAVLRRARSYIRVIQHIAATANHIPRGSPVRKALLREANHEGGHFLGLVRKRFQDEADRSQVAREFLESGLSGVMFRGAVDGHDFWRALRGWVTLRRHAAIRADRRSANGDESLAVTPTKRYSHQHLPPRRVTAQGIQDTDSA
jgi:hypothetical protein